MVKPVRVTVAIPVFQGAGLVGDAIRSVLAQSFSDYEILVVDDGSTDSTVDEIAKLAVPNLRLVTHPTNLGIGHTRNVLLDQARGRYLAWLDQDDRCASGRLRRQYEAFMQTPSLVLVNGLSEDKRDPSQLNGIPVDSKQASRQLLRTRRLGDTFVRVAQGFSNQFTTSACMIDLRVVRDMGLSFDNTLSPAEDYGFWNELILYGDCVILPHLLCTRAIRKDSASAVGSRNQEIASAIVGARYLLSCFGLKSQSAYFEGYSALFFRHKSFDGDDRGEVIGKYLMALIPELEGLDKLSRQVVWYFVSTNLLHLVRHHGLLRRARGRSIFESKLLLFYFLKSLARYYLVRIS